jgi:disulfide bond formation protein DsbB
MTRHSQSSFFSTRTPWVALAGIALAMEVFALLSQHLGGLDPCNECVYIRFGVLGLLVAGLGGALAPKFVVSRVVFGALAALALGYALARAYVLVDLERQVAAGIAASCGRFKGFVGGLPLHQWLPGMFEPRAMCGQVNGTFLGQSFAVWTLVGLAALAVVAVAVCLRDRRRP